MIQELIEKGLTPAGHLHEIVVHMSRRIVVAGSLNMDLVLEAGRIPVPGETLACSELVTVPGGKGANQACAAARLGGAARMAGQVGNDVFGAELLRSLQLSGTEISSVRTIAGATGTAVILVLPNGENSIMISAGANGSFALDASGLEALQLRAGDCLLAQLEIPLDTTFAAMRHARERGAVTILDPAPARPLPAELLRLTDWLTPNQTEAAILLGEPGLQIDSYDGAATAARELRKLGPAGVIVKLGALGCVIANEAGVRAHSAWPVTALDTTAAGDVFNAAFAVALMEGQDEDRAARFACAAAAISVTRRGAQPSMPTRQEVDDLLQTATRETICL